MTDLTRPTRSELTCDEVRELAAPFVLDALEVEEADAVRAHLATCADAHAEFHELAGTLEVLAASVPTVEPPPGLGGRIRAAAAADVARHASDPSDTSDTAGAFDPPPSPIDLAGERQRRRPAIGSWALRIAAVLAIALLGGWNVLLQGELTDAARYERDVAAVLEVAGQEGSMTAVLTPEGGGPGPSGLAALSADGSVRLAMRGLAPTAGSEVYETWVIGGDGVPQALGSFTVDASGVASFEVAGLPTEPGIVLALTREPAPGATTPTLPIVSLGTARAG
jgi:anti-sigma-K factor RskA